MRRFPMNISNSILGNIKYRNNVVTGEVAVDNGNNTYDVYIAGSDVAYPNIPTTLREPSFAVGEAVEMLVEYGNKEMPIIIGRSKKIAQEFTEIEVSYSGGTSVTTLDAYTIIGTTYFEGRISIEEMENCTKQGFYYGTTTGYGSDAYTTGSFAEGSYNKQATGLLGDTTYHFQAYVTDANSDEQTGDDKTMTTVAYSDVLISCDIGTNKIYIHDGVSSGILTSFDTPDTQPEGLAYDGTNLISCDVNDTNIYIHDKISSGISSSFASPGTYSRGLTFDGTNLISCDDDTNKIYIHDGVSSGILSSFDSPGTYSRGLTYDGTNLISSDIGTDTIYIHSGVSSGVSSSFPSPASRPEGLAFDGTNLISCNPDTNKIYIHDGISSGVTSSFTSPDDWPTGITYIS